MATVVPGISTIKTVVVGGRGEGLLVLKFPIAGLLNAFYIALCRAQPVFGFQLHEKNDTERTVRKRGPLDPCGRRGLNLSHREGILT